MGKYRKLTGPAQWVFLVFTWAGVAIVVFNIYRFSIAGQVMLEFGFYVSLLGLFLPLAFLLFPATRSAPRDKVPWYDIVLATIAFGSSAYAFTQALPITEGSWAVRPPAALFVLGLATWAMILEAIRRGTGLFLCAIVGLFSVYPLFASYMPQLLVAKSYSLSRLVGYHYLSNGSIFGIPMQAFGSILIGFMVFGTALDVTGASKFLLGVATGLLGRVRGGPALVSVLASAMLASLSGSAVANVISTGTVTIPAMKKLGMKSHMAAAVESVASTGGVLMPPVMGATAFIMAAVLRISYAEVALAAALPMIVYYSSLFAQVYLYAQRCKLGVWEAKDIPPLRRTFKEGWFYLGSIVVLIYLLFYLRVEAWAPYYASAFLFVCAFLRRETRPSLRTFRQFGMSLGRVLTELLPNITGVGMIIGALFLTGVGQSISGELVALAQANLYALLVFGAIGALILGTGMTITAVYIFMALMFAPALVELGVDPVAAHFFFLYWGMISFITPPVCLSVYAAAAIAGSNIMRTGLQSVRLGIAGFVVPFLFVLNPALLGVGPAPSILWATASAVIGTLVLASGIEGYQFGVGKVGAVGRAILCLAGILVLFTWWVAELAGVMLVLTWFLYHLLRRSGVRGGVMEEALDPASHRS